MTDRFVSDGAEITLSQCQLCQHVAAGAAWTCTAFPEGIPDGVILNQIDHRQPIKGDGGVRFAAKTGVSKPVLKRLGIVLDAAD